MFKPKDPSPLGNPTECWWYWDAKFLDDRIDCDNKTQPINKNGEKCYWGGECFPARIIPVSSDYSPKASQRFKVFDLPVYEPKWYGDRSYLIVPHSKNYHQSINNLKKCLENTFAFYRYKVNEGELFIIFGHSDEVRDRIKSCNAKFLFSESLRR